MFALSTIVVRQSCLLSLQLFHIEGVRRPIPKRGEWLISLAWESISTHYSIRVTSSRASHAIRSLFLTFMKTRSNIEDLILPLFLFWFALFCQRKKNNKCPKHVPPLASLRHLTLTENTPYSLRLTCARNVVYVSYLKEISGLLVKDFINILIRLHINFLVIWAHSSRYDHINWLIGTQILHFSTQHWTIVKQSHNLHLYFSWSDW